MLDDWLRQRAWSKLQTAASRTYVVCPTGSLQAVGYYALSMGQILAQEATGGEPSGRHQDQDRPAGG